MNPDDKLRNAFRDLEDRVDSDVPPGTDPSTAGRSGLLSGPGLAVAGLVVVVGAGALAIGLAGGGDDDQPLATDATMSTTEGTATTLEPDPDDGATTSDPDMADPGDDVDDPDDGQRFRVATAAVAADTADPFLNVRADPAAAGDLVAKLPANYTGLLATGESEAAADGGNWIEVELIHPVAVVAGTIDDPRRPTGWVNQAFVEPLVDGLPVGADELAACDPAAGGAGADGTLADGHVASMESRYLTGDCLRVVLTFGSGPTGFAWLDLPEGTGPAEAVPDVLTLSSGGFASTIDLGPVDSAWPAATDTTDDLYLARGDDGRLDLVMVARADVVGITARPDIGALVIDLLVDGPIPAPAAEAGVVLTGPPLIGSGTIEVTGLARPFEAMLSVWLEDDSGQRVEAVFSGNGQIGTRSTTEYGAAANDWTEAWGRFAVRVEGLDAGDYTLVLTDDALEDPPALRIPFTVESGGSAPTLADATETAVATAMVRFGRSGPDADLPLADEVLLLLGPEVATVADPADLLDDRQAWVIDEPDGFGGFSGPFSALAQLDDDRVRFTAGPVPHCAGPPRDWPADLAGLRQVNIEPVGIDSCIAWFGVHLFLDDDDRIAAVSLDLFGP